LFFICLLVLVEFRLNAWLAGTAIRLSLQVVATATLISLPPGIAAAYRG
jgi:hypothetical protein